MARNQLGIDLHHWPRLGNITHARQCARKGDRLKPRRSDKRRRAPALGKPVLRNQNSQARGQKVYRDARDQLVAPKGDRGDTMNKRKHHRCADPCQHPEPNIARSKSHSGRKQRSGKHLALKANVKNPCALRVKPCKAGQQKRRGKAHGAVEHLNDREKLHQSASFFLRMERNTRSSGARTI